MTTNSVPGRPLPTRHAFDIGHVGAWGWFAYSVFVIYGSLVPLDFRAMPLEAAWRDFANVPFLNLGIDSRADWIANGVLYLPVGFLSVLALRAQVPGFGKTAAAAIAAVFAFNLAVGVEFSQLFFPPRTVSLNDLLAEAIGALAGILIATRWMHRVGPLMASIRDRTGALAPRLLEAYALAFVALGLFPYDFLLSEQEIAGKLASGRVGWLFASGLSGENWISAVLVRPIMETVVAFPVGLLVARLRGGGRQFPIMSALGYGALLGATMETAQFFIASGYSQGASILTRAAAFGLAATAWNARQHLGVQPLATLIRGLTPVLLPAYIAALAAASGLFRGGWDTAHLPGAIAELHFLPFYYHYFTTEAKALNSLLGISALYVPVGIFCWAWKARFDTALALAALLALSIESGKMLLPSLRADPTNLLVAAAAAWAALQILRRIGAATRPPAATTTPGSATPGIEAMQRSTTLPPIDARAAQTASPGLVTFASMGIAHKTLLTVVGAAVAAWLTGFPTQPWLLGLLYAAFAITVWIRPQWIFGLALAALPMLDLAHWSGRFYLDEYDALLAIGLAIGFARLPKRPPARRDLWLAPAVMLLGATYAIGSVRGMWPARLPDANAFNNYMSAFAGLRIVKGALLAALMWQLWRRASAFSGPPRASLGWGLSAGLAWTTACIIVERLVFSSLLDFSSDYRVTGPFSQMHTGGAYVECFLTLATPLLVMSLLQTRSVALRAASAACLLGTAYALMVTFSRGGYAAFGLAVSISVASFIFARNGRRFARPAALLLGAMVVAVSLPILISPYAQQRISGTAQDVKIREAHWNDALAIIPTGALATLFGAGLGRYPDVHYWQSSENNRSATYRLERDEARAWLRVGAGPAMFIDQIVAVDPRFSLTLTARLRAPAGAPGLGVSLCRKWLYTATECTFRTLKFDGTRNDWQTVSTEFLPNPGVLSWPIKFSIHSPAGNVAIDVTDLALRHGNGANLIANGDFTRGLDHWFFSNDEHLSWHVKNLPIAILFDLGWLGLAAFGWLAALALWRSGNALLRGDTFAGALFASLSGFLVIGLIDSLIDTPRFLLLFLFLTLLACETRQRDIA